MNKTNIYKTAYEKEPNQRTDDLLHYLQSFNPYELKYSVLSDRLFYNDNSPCILDNTRFQRTIPFEALSVVEKYDSIFRTGEITKENYSYIKENLSLVYGDPTLVSNDIQLYHYTEKKIIHEYLAIPQLDKMFDEDYFNFEWDMHVGQNFNEHRNEYYRDHFVHQIRVMHSMLMLLGRHGFFDSIFDILFEKNNGKIMQFANLKLEEFLQKKEGAYNVISSIYSIVQSRIESLLSIIPNTDNIKQVIIKRYTDGAYYETYFKKYVIYASCILAALFHDMGYPICHFFEVRHRVSEYNPVMHMFTHNAFDSFDTIASKLGGCLLFTIASNKEIKSALEIDSNGRFDHGAYSAIAFLMQFYNNGLIYSLPVEKQCAIELAAVAIYNHTRTYKVMKPKKDSNYFQPVYSQNPISFLLRLCDDLQEWERRYFEISEGSDISFCSKCLLPIQQLTHVKRGNLLKNFCACKGKKKDKSPKVCSFRDVEFLSRKLYLVTTSSQMISNIVQTKDDENVLYFRIDYNLFKLLCITRINSSYATFRAKDLNNIKKLLKYQVFQKDKNDILEFKCIYIDYFMSSNPILIKIKILEKYLSFFWCEGKEQLRIPNSELLVLLNQCTGKTLCNRLKLDVNSFLWRIMQNDYLLNFYKELLKICIKARMSEDKKPVTCDLDRFLKFYTSDDSLSTMYCETIRGLVWDCYNQYSKETIVDENGHLSINSLSDFDPYYAQYQPENTREENLLTDCVNTYCRAENDFNSYEYFDNTFSNKYIGFYADLYLFKKMNDIIQEKYDKQIHGG